MIIETEIFCWRENKELEKAGVNYEPENVWTQAVVNVGEIMYAHKHPDDNGSVMIGLNTGDEITVRYDFEKLKRIIQETL